jgi:hypothetical protein
MNDSKQRLITGASIIVATVVLLGIMLFLLFRPEKKTDNNSVRSMDVTEFYSPLTQTSDSLTVNYGGEANPNKDAVKQQFKLFNPSGLPMAQESRDSLSAIIQDALLSEVTPTYPATYVHVVKDSVKCGNGCTMELYIDSPETYFSLTLSSADGVPSYEITQIPWKGID